MKKKAQTDLLVWLMNILLVSIIIITLLYSVDKINKGTYFEEKVFSKNLALFYDSIMASTYKSEATYTINDSYKLTIDLDENCFVRIINPSQSFTSYSCALDTNMDVNCRTKESCLIKDNFIAIKNG